MQQQTVSGNIKINNSFHFKQNINAQIVVINLAPDIIPQVKINTRFSVNLGLKKIIQKGNAELFLNATDLFNTMAIKRTTTGKDFYNTSNDYYETQVKRAGYSNKF